MALTKFSKPVGSVPAYFHVDSFVSKRFGFVYHCVPKTLSRSMLEYSAAVDHDGHRIGEKRVGKEILAPDAVAGTGAASPSRGTRIRESWLSTSTSSSTTSTHPGSVRSLPGTRGSVPT